MEIATFQDFIQLVRDVWENGVYGIRFVDWLLAIVIFCFFLLIRNLFTRFVIGTIRRAARRTKTTIDDQVLDAIAEPVRFIPIAMGIFFGSSVLDVGEDLEFFFTNINRSLVTFALFWAFYRAVGPIGNVLTKARKILTAAMVEWLVKSAKIGFVLLGAATILEMWGIAVAPIIAGLGLFGVAVALGAQDLFKNLISGLFVIGEQRFHPGDWVNVDGIAEGVVEEIGFRTTKIRRFDKAPVYVPNSKLSDNAVTNFQRMTYRRIKWLIGVEYGTTKDQLVTIRDAIDDYILKNDDFVNPPDVPSFVRVDAFADSSINILVYCFTKTTNWGEWLEVKEKLALKVKEIVEDAGTGFAFPSRSLYMETWPQNTEAFPLQPQADTSDTPQEQAPKA